MDGKTELDSPTIDIIEAPLEKLNIGVEDDLETEPEEVDKVCNARI